MIINKFVSCKAIIDAVYRDMYLQDQINYEDCAYWIFESLGLLNQPIQLLT